MEKTLLLEIDGKTYPLLLKKKAGVKRMTLRYKKEKGEFSLTCPYFTPDSRAYKMAKEHANRLLSRVESLPKPYEGAYLYLLGDRHYVGEMGEEERKAYLKKMALPLFEERVAHYEKLMGVRPPYRVKARSMKTRYGVNSKKTHSITLQSELIHFRLEIIDSVVVHELAHHFEFNHGPAFYRIVYRFCPEYEKWHACLRKGEFNGTTDLKE